MWYKLQPFKRFCIRFLLCKVPEIVKASEALFFPVLTLIFEHVYLGVGWVAAQSACCLLTVFEKACMKPFQFSLNCLIQFVLIFCCYGGKKNLSQNSINESLSHSHCGLYAHLSCPSLSAGVLWHPERFLRYF